MKKPKRERRRIHDLVDYPLQVVFVGTTSEQDDDDLKFSIAEEGLRDPIEILPDNSAGLPSNSILDGHRRRNAQSAIGESSVPVVVRYDLAAVDRATIDRLFLERNSVRRQLDPLARAYLAVKLIEIEQERPLSEVMQTAWEADDVRDRVGKQLGTSGRHLSRLLRVIQTPLPVQVAVRQKQLSIVAAEKVVDLPCDVQNDVAERIEAGEDAKAVISSVTGEAGTKPKTAETSFRRYIKALSAAADHLSGRMTEIRFSPTDEELSLLKACSELNKLLLNKLRANTKANRKRRGKAVSAMKEVANKRRQ